MTVRVVETGRFYEMEMDVEKTKVMRTSWQPSPAQIMTDQNQLDNMEYFNCLGSTITNDARCTCEIKSSNAMVRAAFNKKKAPFTSKLD